MQTFDNTRPLVAAMAIGVARACLEHTTERLAEAGVEIDYDRPANSQHAAAAELLELEADYEAARLLTLEAAWMADNSQAELAARLLREGEGGPHLRRHRAALRRALRRRRARRGRAAREVGARREDPRHLRGHPADPAADHRPAAARADLGRAEVAWRAMRNREPAPVAVLGSNRIPFARSNGPYAKASNQDMLTAALDGLIDRAGIDGERLGEVAGGAVLKHSRDFNLTRESLLGTRLSPETPAYDVGQACGTGLETAILVANKIALGQVDSGDRLRRRHHLRRADRAQRRPARDPARGQQRAAPTSTGVRALLKVRPGHIVPEIPRNSEPRTGLSMGEHTAIMASDWGITREAQDELAAASHQHLAAAYDEGFEDDLVTPYLGLERDQNLRPDSTVEKLGKLKPVFGGADGHDDRRQLDAAQRRRLRRAARHRGVGGRARPRRSWPASSTPRPRPSTTSAAATAC